MKIDRVKWLQDIAAAAAKLWGLRAELEAAEKEVRRLNNGDADHIDISTGRSPAQCDGRPDSKECTNVVVAYSWDGEPNDGKPIYCKDCTPRIEAGKRAVRNDQVIAAAEVMP